MSKFNVVVTEKSIDVPGTGAFTGDGANGFGGVGIGILITLLIVMATVSVVMLKKRRIQNGSPKGGFSIGGKGGKIGGLFVIVLLTVSLVVPLAMSSNNAEKAFAGEGEKELTISTDNNKTLNIETDKDKAFITQYANQHVYISENTQNGYVLSLYASSADLIPTDSSVQTVISGLQGNGLQALSDNTWGISLVDPTVESSDTIWNALPTTEGTALVLKDTHESTSPNDITTFYYGVRLTDATEPATYSTTLNFVATAYVETEQP